MSNREKMEEQKSYSELYVALTMLEMMIGATEKDLSLVPGGRLLVKELRALYGKLEAELQLNLLKDVTKSINGIREQLKEEDEHDGSED